MKLQKNARYHLGVIDVINNISSEDSIPFPGQEEPTDKADYKKIVVLRQDPSVGFGPVYYHYWVNVKECGPMILDALIKIKDELDPTLAFRRSCREGICGSCSMNINGKNTLACLCKIDPALDIQYITPLTRSYAIKDLVVDMTHFYNQYRYIRPYLQRKDGTKDYTDPEEESKEYYQSMEDRAKLDGLYECVLCASCQTSCPVYWWHQDNYLGPAVLMQAYRWIVDSRDQYTKERISQLLNDEKAVACHQIGVCSKTCPKGLDPKSAIASLITYVNNQKTQKNITSAE